MPQGWRASTIDADLYAGKDANSFLESGLVDPERFRALVENFLSS